MADQYPLAILSCFCDARGSMKARLFLFLPLILFSYFFLIPHTSDNAYAVDICQRGGLKTKCSADKKSVLEPKINKIKVAACAAASGVSLGALTLSQCKDACDYGTRKCSAGQSCQAVGGSFDCKADPNLKNNDNCTCAHSGSTKDKENGMNCTVNGKVQNNAKYCNPGQKCVNDANKKPQCQAIKCTCTKPNESADMTCEGITNEALQKIAEVAKKVGTADVQEAQKLTTTGFKTCNEDKEVCVQKSPGQIDCKPKEGTCKCTNPGQKGKGKNGYKCTKPGESKPSKEETCPDEKSACQDSPDTTNGDHPGITCSEEAFQDKGEKNGPIPPPPSPPCAEGEWQNNKCNAMITAFGKIETNPEQFIQRIFAILLSLSGGIALLLIIKAGYQLLVSQGTPEKIQQAREQLIAAIVGLLFMIFSFVLLQAIGFDILKLPKSELPAAEGGINTEGAPEGAQSGQANQSGENGNKQKGEVCTSTKECANGLSCKLSTAKAILGIVSPLIGLASDPTCQ